MDYETLRLDLHKFGYYLEHYEEWFGEPGEYKYILLGTTGSNIGLSKTLKGVLKFLGKEKRIIQGKEKPAKTIQLTIL
jgi:hypothetical protein